MSKIISLISFLIIVLSCEEKPQHSIIEDVSDNIRGKYECVSAIFESAVDLNDDGNKNADILYELNYPDSFSRILVPEIILPYIIDPQELFYRSINFNMALQGVDFDKESEQYLRNPIFYTIKSTNLYYSIDSEGIISYGEIKNSLYNYQEYLSRTSFIDDKESYVESFNFTQDGIINIYAHQFFLDYATNEIKTGTVHYVFERTSYSL